MAILAQPYLKIGRTHETTVGSARALPSVRDQRVGYGPRPSPLKDQRAPEKLPRFFPDRVLRRKGNPDFRSTLNTHRRISSVTSIEPGGEHVRPWSFDPLARQCGRHALRRKIVERPSQNLSLRGHVHAHAHSSVALCTRRGRDGGVREGRTTTERTEA